MTNKIILASASERRITLLKKWGLKFKIYPSNINEISAYKRPSAIVKDLAMQKAKNIQKIFKDDIIISADTIVVLKGKIIGKPKDHEHSDKILKDLNGSIHKVYTGVSILSGNKSVVFYDAAKVKMRRLTTEKLMKLAGKHMDKAGAYAVQDTDDDFVEKIYGDYFTVVGLPYIKLKKKLSQFGIKLK